MIRKIKVNLIVITIMMFALSVLCSAMVVAKADVDELANKVNSTNVYMGQGASVRFGTDESTMGLRYTLLIKNDDYNTLGNDVSYGMFFLPKDYVDIHPLDTDLSYYYWANGESEYVDKDDNVLDASGKVGKALVVNFCNVQLGDSEDYTATEMKCFYGSLVNIKDGSDWHNFNIDREFIAIGYIKYITAKDYSTNTWLDIYVPLSDLKTIVGNGGYTFKLFPVTNGNESTCGTYSISLKSMEFVEEKPLPVLGLTAASYVNETCTNGSAPNTGNWSSATNQTVGGKTALYTFSNTTRDPGYGDTKMRAYLRYTCSQADVQEYIDAGKNYIKYHIYFGVTDTVATITTLSVAFTDNDSTARDISVNEWIDVYIPLNYVKCQFTRDGNKLIFEVRKDSGKNIVNILTNEGFDVKIGNR